MHRTFLGALCFITVCAPLHAGDWLQFGGPTRDFRIQQSIPMGPKPPTKRWQQKIGPGMAGVAVADGTIYTSYLLPFEDPYRPESKRAHREAIVALDADNGNERWRYEYDAGWLEPQQAFGGRSRAPQATPAVCDSYLLGIGFTGILNCLDRATGEVVWTINLVERFDAVPVQFGFAASPLVLGDRVVVLAGGEAGGLVCLNVKTGEPIWNVPCNEVSYATPVLWSKPDGVQIVFVTRNRIVGVAANDGTFLWDYRLPGPGMTNVPTPMPVTDTGIIVSGQGVKGTRRLEVSKSRSGYEVAEAWKSNEQFFYCNWVHHAGLILGYSGNLFTAVDVDSGKTVGQFRGFNDANMLLASDQLLVFDGDGHLSELSLAAQQMQVNCKYAVLNERCWTPPTPHGNLLFCRGGDELLCLDLTGGDPRAAVASAKVRKRSLRLQSAVAVAASVEAKDAMQQILAAMEQRGADSAWNLYNAMRRDDPDCLSFDQRRQLAELASGEGLHDYAKLIRQHAEEDFPQEAKRENQTPSSEKTRGENGLLYIQFGIRNTGKQTIQAFVRGPERHPFSYGLPLRPQRLRLEKWPVGTTLYKTENGIRKEVLMTVREDFAGTMIELPTQRDSAR